MLYFPNMDAMSTNDTSLFNKATRQIYRHGRGWAFSEIDFSHLGSAETINVYLHRLCAKGTIRRVIRGIYDYPRFSKLLGETMCPDLGQVAKALARKFGWRIWPSGPAALNLMGISTQVPGRVVYYSDGPNRTYSVLGNQLAFKHSALKEAAFTHFESAVIVQGLKSLGMHAVTETVIERMRQWLPTEMRKKVLRDTQTVTHWVADAVRRICRPDPRLERSV